MLPVLHGDLGCAARAVFAVPEDQRERFCRQLIAEAEAADQFFRQFGKIHPRWGNGSLMAAARAHPMVAEPTFDNTDYAECFGLVLKTLCAVRKKESPVVSRTRR